MDLRIQPNLHKQSMLSVSIIGPVILNLGLAVIYVILWFVAYSRDMFWRADFSSFYTSAVIIWSGRGPELYNLETQAEVQSEALKDYIQPGALALRYVNPPHIAVLFAPLALFDVSGAFVVWTLVQLLLLARLLWLLTKAMDGWTINEKWLSISAVLGLHFLMLNFMLGALTLFMLVGLFEVYLARRKQNQIKSGAWLVLMSVKPQLTVLLAAAFISPQCRKAFVSAVIITLGLLLALSLALGWNIWPDYLKLLLNHSNLWDDIGVDPTVMYNLKGALTLVSGEMNKALVNIISYTALIIGILGIAFLWLSNKQQNQARLELLLALTVILGLVLSPHTNPQDGLLLVFSGILFYSYLRQNHRPHKGFAIFASSSPLLFLLAEFGLGDGLGIRIPFIAMLIFLAWIAWEGWLNRKKAHLGEEVSWVR